jgi:hypothetical protein
MRKPKLRGAAVAALAGLALAAGGGAAIAATQSSGDQEAFLADVAKRLGVQQTELESALKQASIARVDAAVEAGRLTEAQAEEIKERIEAGDGPLLGGPMFGGRMEHHIGPHLDMGAAQRAAATYLGMTQQQIRRAHLAGTSLAELAETRGKSVDGLKAAMVAAAKKALDQAVTAGRITPEERERIAENLSERIDAWVEGDFPGPRGGERGLRQGGGFVVPGPMRGDTAVFVPMAGRI